MSEFFKKYPIEIGTVAVLVIVVLVIIVLSPKTAQAPRDTSAPTAPVSPTQTTPPPASRPAASPQPQATSALKITDKPTSGLNYQQVAELYSNRRMQFDQACRATPNFMTFKNEVEIMFDNRTPTEKTIRLDGSSYRIGAFGFIVLAIVSSTLPNAVKLDCNQFFNVAVINLQK